MDLAPMKSKKAKKPRPKCIGMGDSGMTNLSERVDDLLYADLGDYLKNLEDYEEKLVRGDIQAYTIKINQED
jgi:hypothetical protein